MRPISIKCSRCAGREGSLVMSLQVLIAGLGTYPCSSKMQRGRRLWGGVCVFGFAVAGSRIPPQPHPSFLSLPSSGMPAAVAAAAEAAEAAEATARGGGHGGGSGGGSGVGGVGGSLNGGDATQTPQHPASLLTWLVQARAAAPVSPTPGPDAALQRRLRRRFQLSAPPPPTGLGEAAGERNERMLWLLRLWRWPSQRR